MVDYAENSKADTGLFTKIVPEIRKPTAVVPIVRRTDDENKNNINTSIFAAPKTITSAITDLGHHRQWAENVNKRLAAMRFNISDLRKFPTDRYLGYNRGNMLVTTTLSPADVNVETVKIAAVTLPPVAAMTYSDGSSSADQRKRKQHDWSEHVYSPEICGLCTYDITIPVQIKNTETSFDR